MDMDVLGADARSERAMGNIEATLAYRRHKSLNADKSAAEARERIEKQKLAARRAKREKEEQEKKKQTCDVQSFDDEMQSLSELNRAKQTRRDAAYARQDDVDVVDAGLSEADVSIDPDMDAIQDTKAKHMDRVFDLDDDKTTVMSPVDEDEFTLEDIDDLDDVDL